MEFSSDKMDINTLEDNVTSGGITLVQRLDEDIIKGVATEKQHEVWLRVRKMGWSREKTAEELDYSENTIRNMLATIDNKLREFKRTVKMRGGNFF